jgi:hypothetical protein
MENSFLTLNKLKSLTALKKFETDYVPFTADISGEVGYNGLSGYVYIEYNCGVSIAIFEGRDQEDQILMFKINEEGEEIDIPTIEEFRELFV